jgi:hypothetical protein
MRLNRRGSGVGARLDAGQRVGVGEHQGADQQLDVVAAGDEGAAQLVEQLGMAGGVLGGQVIDRVHQADAEEVGPQAVGQGAGEVWVVRRGDPVGQRGARVGAAGRDRSVEETSGDGAAGAGDGQVAVAFSGEEGGLTPEVVALPPGVPLP